MKLIESPFVGLVPYDAESRRYFCGREQETDLITANASSSRLTVFYGLSGAGKSSILCAGLIPWLQETKKTLDSAQTLEPFRPLSVLLREQWSLDPWTELRKCVVKALKAWPQYSGRAFPQAWFSQAGQGGNPRSSEASPRSRAEVPKLVLVLDQFEELFIQHPDLVSTPPSLLLKLAEEWRNGEQPRGASAGQLMAACIIALLNDPAAPVNIVFSLREDCLASLDVFKGLIPDLFGTMLRIEPLDADGVRCVITESLKRWGEDHGGNPGAFRPEEPTSKTEPPHEGLIAEIVNDQALWVRDPARSDRKEGLRRRYETPFLQIVLERLWREDIGPDKASSGGMLTVATYRRLEGASGIRKSFVDACLDRHLAYQPERQRWFLEATRYLVSRTQKFPWRVSDLVEEIKPGLKQDQVVAPTVAAMTALLALFLADKIIRELPHDGPEDPRFEVAHDALAGDIYRWRVGQFAILDTKRNEEARLVELKRQEKEQEDRQRIQQDEEAKAAARIGVLKFAFDRLARISAVLMLCLLVVAGLLFYQAYKARVQAKVSENNAMEAEKRSAEAERRAAEAAKRGAEAERLGTEAAKLAAEAQQARAAANDRVKDVEEKNKGLAKQLDDLVAKTNTLQVQAKSLASLGHAFEESLKPAGIKDPFIGRIVSTLDAFSKAATDLGIDLKDTNESFAEVKSLVNNFKWLQGKVQTWGGRDGRRGFGDSLAIVQTWKEAAATGVFRAEPDRSKPPRASELDPKQHYIAARWDYKATPREWLLRTKVRVKNLKTGMILEAQPVEWGPPTDTVYMMALSPGLADALDLKEGDEAAYDVPLPPKSDSSTTAPPSVSPAPPGGALR